MSACGLTTLILAENKHRATLLFYSSNFFMTVTVFSMSASWSPFVNLESHDESWCKEHVSLISSLSVFPLVGSLTHSVSMVGQTKQGRKVPQETASRHPQPQEPNVFQPKPKTHTKAPNPKIPSLRFQARDTTPEILSKRCQVKDCAPKVERQRSQARASKPRILTQKL